MQNSNNITKNRFILSNSLLGQNAIITFTNKKGESYTYNHDQVFAKNQSKLLSMNCFIKYGNYTNSNKLPNWAI
mgnify:FL=1|jgi:hypothetical protein